MKQIILALAIVAFFFTTEVFAQNNKTNNASNSQTAVNYKTYNKSYFEKNNSGLKGDTSFVILSNQNQFDKIFGTAAVMGNNEFLPENLFNSQIIVATIKRGNFVRSYEVKKVTTDKNKLYVWYDATDQKQESATFASPLIIAVNKGKYKEVVFMENGKQVGSAPMRK